MVSSAEEVAANAGRIPFSEIVRRWPLVLAVTLVAVAASLAAAASREPTYSATAQLVITPLPQWDETFLGTSLVRDAGDANRTAATIAQVVDSPAVARETAAVLGDRTTERLISEAVQVEPVAGTNVLAVTAMARDRGSAVRMADAFAASVLAVRWRSIEQELDERIALITRIAGGDAGAEEAAQPVRTLRVIRSAGSDPTMTLTRSRPATKVGELPTPAIVALALGGGLFVGALIALVLARIGEQAAARSPNAG